MCDAPPNKKTKMSDAEEVKFSLKVMINKEKTKVLFAEADRHFVDILLSFLSLPLGRIVKLLEQHYGEEAPTVGSLNTLYHGLANLDSSYFWTKGAKMALVDPRSSCEAEYQHLKLDICDHHPGEYFVCIYNNSHNRVRSVSMYYDRGINCLNCSTNFRGFSSPMRKEVAKKGSQAATSKGVFITHTTSFIVSDDLQILPTATGLLGIVTTLGITDAVRDKAEQINVTFGYNEIMSLLKASLISQTPLSDLILNKSRQMNSVAAESEPKTSSNQIERKEKPNSKKMILKAVILKSTSKLLYAQAEEDFVEFLFSLLCIPVGGVERLRLGGGKTCIKAIHNLCRSTADLIDDKYFKSSDVKKKLLQFNLPHGYISENHILPLKEECFPAHCMITKPFSSDKFPKGQGSYLEGPRIYHVTDDLTVTPFCFVSIFASLDELKISTSDVREVDLQIGLEEGLRILKASLTSTSALSDALLNHTSIKQPKPEIHNS